MKRTLILIFIAMVAMVMFAQNDVTTFLGIPIDGYKPEMRRKLIEKGFTPKWYDDTEYFVGEFNGANVNVYIVTNNNKVYRIMICDADRCSEANIKIKFNRLVSQFNNNKRYVSLKDYTLSEDVDISYEMSVHNKNFDARFYQAPDIENIDSTAIMQQAYDELVVKYTPEQLENPTEKIAEEIYIATAKICMDYIAKKLVWFRICEYAGKYYITMYYDNVYNQANGEDL